MSRVANNLPTASYSNGHGQTAKSILNRSTSTNKNLGGDFPIRSAAPPPIQKETVHACPLCNNEYKDPRVLPCTHTYCFNCIRDKLIKNSRITCPKCHYQAHPFDEVQLNELPPNLILSQEWRIGARPIVSIPTIKKPVTYQSNVSIPISQSIAPLTQMSQQQDKRKGSMNDQTSTNGNNSRGITSIVNTYNQPFGGVGGDNENQSSRSSSVSSTQPVVSNLIKIYSEASVSKPQRNESVVSTNKHDELIKIFEQASNRNQRQQQYRRISSSPAEIKQPVQAHEEAYEEITWDNLAHGTTPVAPPFPEQFHSAVENHHYPPEASERPMSISSSRQNSSIGNLCHIVSTIHHESPEKTSPIRQISIPEIRSNIRQSITSDDDENLHVHETINPLTPQRQHIRQISNADSVRSGRSDSASRRSPISPIKTINQQKSNGSSPYQQQQQQQQQDDKVFHRTSSITSSSRRSSDRFPPPPQNLETFESTTNGHNQQRSTSSMSYRSSIHEDVHTPEAKLIRTERFSPDVNISPTNHRNNSSQIGSHFSTLTVEHQTYQSSRQQENSFSPTSSSSLVPTVVTSRVDLLLSDQKRLEREIEEQIRRLKYDYDDVRKQIGRKESAIHNEVKHIATRLDDDITEHFHRKQKIYADLAVDANTVGTELERLRSNTNNNKQQLWANLEQIESNIRSIRQAVEQHREPHNALTFAEGHQSLAADTIGQITYHGIDSHQRYSSSPVSHKTEQLITNLTPYKYLKIDHLSTLEPEAIAITENNKKILLGICNKLFILNEYGDTLRTIQLTPSIRGIALAKKSPKHNIAYISHDEMISMIDIDNGQTLDCVKETDSSGDSGTFLPLGIDTDNIYGNVYVCDYRNACVIKFDEKLEFQTQWRIYNHSDRYDEARPKLISVYGKKLYMIVEHSCKPYYNQGIAYTFSLHICDANSGSIIKIIDADLLSTQRLRWPCSVQAINHETCYILDTMTSGKYFNGQWQKHWSRVLQIGQEENNLVKELFQLDSEAATMAMTKQTMIIAANGEILFVDLAFIQQQ